MLQFFKKSGQRDRPSSLQSSPVKSINLIKSFGDAFNVSASIHASSSILYSLEEEEKNEICNAEENEVCSFRSQLSKTLPEILADKGALGYFIQFMDTRNCIALIKFWLEVECLCGSFTASNSMGKGNNDLSHSTTPAVEELCSFSSTLDDNENFNCNVFRNNLNMHDAEQDLYNERINSNDIKSNYENMPKTSHVLSDTRQSNHKYEDKKVDPMIIRQDAVRIHKKYIVKEALGTNRIPEELKLETEKALMCDAVEPILRCLSAIQNIVYNILENEHINDFLRSEFHCKHQIDVLTSGNVQLADVLYNETAFFYFMEFMELEGKRALLDFWMSAINYKQNLSEKKDSVISEEAQSDALIIYDKYFSLQATMPLGFSDKIRFQVEQNICREDGEGPLPDCFDKPCKIIYKFLNKHYLPTFLSSQLYYKYLSELISTIQSSPCPTFHSRMKRAGSDCSSEISSASNSMQGTLQIGSEGNKMCNSKTYVKNSMNIDTRQLYDPDSLWKRNKYNLSVGYIDNLGRFVTEIEPDPRRKYESRLARAVKRLVNIEQDKAKEELAWKIAEMIVHDITSLTLGTSNLPP